jgi:hypothetical protein
MEGTGEYHFMTTKKVISWPTDGNLPIGSNWVPVHIQKWGFVLRLQLRGGLDAPAAHRMD